MAMNSNPTPPNNSNKSHSAQHVQYVSPSPLHPKSSLVRIRTPQPHDVLCGRGGGINSHAGNKTFRNWVRERKEAYNLASSKAAKAQVSREILDRIRELDPPGRFLQREDVDGGTPFWVEIDEAKAMAKTSQALREGAPTIRARAKMLEEDQEIIKNEKKEKDGKPVTTKGSALTQKLLHGKKSHDKKSSGNRSHPSSPIKTSKSKIHKPCVPPIIPIPATSAQLGSFLPPPPKRCKTSSNPPPQSADYAALSSAVSSQETPTLLPVPYSSSPPIAPLLNPQEFTSLMSASRNNRKRSLPRSHSLALSDISGYVDVEESDGESFNDPFASEEDMDNFEGCPDLSATRTQLARLASTGSNSNGRNDRGLVRNTSDRVSVRSTESSRSLISDLGDLPETHPDEYHDWNEGMRDVYDACHPGITDLESENTTLPTYLYPYKSNIYIRKRDVRVNPRKNNGNKRKNGRNNTLKWLDEQQ